MSLTSEEQLDFKNAVYCHICDEHLGADRVRDHDHLTGKYRGPLTVSVIYSINSEKVKRGPIPTSTFPS